MARNPHAGEPFTDDDAAIERWLEDTNVPALLCSLVHMTGDPSWIRGDVRPRMTAMPDIQRGIGPDERDEVRRRALPVVLAYRDGGCEPVELDRDLLREMMAFLGGMPVTDTVAGLFFDDLQFDGADSGAVSWGEEVPAEVRAASPVVVVGCGLAGILAGIRLRQAGLPFTILDKNAGPGGTWWENRYPGARVDVASHQYCYAFEPAEHWSEYYCQQPELAAYFAGIVQKYDLAPHCRFETAVTDITWQEQSSTWRVLARDGAGDDHELEARFVISAVGSLNIPKLPDIEGMESFAGPSFHSARWPEGLDIAGTRFALLGAGASGFQIGPAVADTVEHLTVFQRTAQWIIPNPIYHQAVPEGDRWALRHLPFYGRWYRFIVSFPGIGAGMEPFRIDPTHDDPTGLSVNPGLAQRAEALVASIESIVDDPELLEKVVPDYPAVGKRILQDDGTWLRTLLRPDVELVRTAVDHIEPDGVVTVDGVHHAADVLCFATGFRHNDFLATLAVTGRDGLTLRELWGDEPTAYLGITVAGFPNLFCVYGPGTNLAAGAGLFYHSEFQVHYAMDAIHETLVREATSCEVTRDAYDEYARRHQDEISQMVWAHPSIEHSHYKNPQGRVFTLSPWALDAYWSWTRRVDTGHYTFR